MPLPNTTYGNSQKYTATIVLH